MHPLQQPTHACLLHETLSPMISSSAIWPLESLDRMLVAHFVSCIQRHFVQLNCKHLSRSLVSAVSGFYVPSLLVDVSICLDRVCRRDMLERCREALGLYTTSTPELRRLTLLVLPSSHGSWDIHAFSSGSHKHARTNQGFCLILMTSKSFCISSSPQADNWATHRW